MDRQEQTRILASLTDDELKQLRAYTRNLFGRDARDPDEIERQRLANPETEPRGNVVSREGENPRPPAAFSYEDHLRQLALELFNPDRAATDPATFDVYP